MMEHYINGKRVFLYTFAGYEEIYWYAHERLMNELELLNFLISIYARAAQDLQRWETDVHRRLHLDVDEDLVRQLMDRDSDEALALQREHDELRDGSRALREAGFVAVEARQGVFCPEHHDVTRKLEVLRERRAQL